MKKNLFLLILVFATAYVSLAQPATDLNCQQNVFYGTVGNAIHSLLFSATGVTDLGPVAPSSFSTLNSVAFGNDITQNSSNRTLYSVTQSGLSPCSILRWTGSAWATIVTDSLVYHQAGGYGPFIYFMHAFAFSGPNNQCISRLNANSMLTKIFTDTSLVFTVADLSVDSSGNVYFFRGNTVGATTELTVINPAGNIINNITTNLNNLSTIFGSMFFNDTLYIGHGATNTQLRPVIISGNSATLGTPVPIGFSLKDLASCHQPRSNSTEIKDLSFDQSGFIFQNPVQDGQLNIFCNHFKNANLQLCIYNVAGQKVLQMQEMMHDLVVKVDVTRLPKGI